MNRQCIFTIILAAAIFNIITVCAQNTEKYRANSQQIRYMGRVINSDAGEVSFDWSGIYLTTNFDGEYIAMRVSDTKKNYYNLYIDGVEQPVISTFGKDSLIVLGKGLGNGTHSLRLQKRTEAEQGITTIHSFELSKGHEFIADKCNPTRHIEFIGNSLTCGFGTEGKSANEPFLPETENCNKAFGCIISRYFDADYTLISHSGQGAARNYGEKTSTSAHTMRERMGYTFDTDSTKKWDFSKYRPDLVVINLGTNDFSTPPFPSKEEFADAYTKIINRVRHEYGNVKILCIAMDFNDLQRTIISNFCANTKDPNLHLATLLKDSVNKSSDLGSSSHPNYTGHKKMAMILIPYISTITGWQIEPKVVQ